MYNHKKITSLLKKVKDLEASALAVELEKKAILKHIHHANMASARNLLHYLAIRSQDIQTLQNDLSELAISSNSHSESYTLNSLQKIKYLLSCIAGEKPDENLIESIDSNESARILKHNSESLFGKFDFDGQSKIMVTLATEAGDDYDLVLDMIKAGMEIARINTAHDNKMVWKKMVHNIKKAAKEIEKKVKIYMDIEGPKIRTGKIKSISNSSLNDNDHAPFIPVYIGSKITLTPDDIEGHGGDNPIVSITLPNIFEKVKCNDSVWFDDGKLGGVVCDINNNNIIVEITNAPVDGFKLKAEKGINFPESDLNVAALTDEDIDHLKFIAKHADMVGSSFVQKPSDVFQLQKQLKHLDREDLGIILKIETRQAFENFPSLLFAVMGSKHSGVMIARGDLAVEIGYLRIAEVQEEIMWLAEAAHLPVIWATQVLETQIKKGTATRAEISDVVKAVRAECVMLNKGPHIIDAIVTVKDIDKRMAAHEDKKRKILRSLHVAKAFLQA